MVVFQDFVVVSTLYPIFGDYGTIQDAIDDGAVSIYVKSGLYVTTETITVPSGVVVYGESVDTESGGVIISFNEDDWGFIIQGYGARISGLRVVHSRNARGAFVFDAAEQAIVERCRIDGCDRAATFIASTHCQFSENWAQGSMLESVFVDSVSTDNRIFNNRLFDGHNYGIYLEGAFNKVVDNTITGHTYDGILVTSKMNAIRGNTCNNNENGIYVAMTGGDNNSLMGNTCIQNRGYGININSLENAGNVAVGNTLHENGVADLRFVPGNVVVANDAGTTV